MAVRLVISALPPGLATLPPACFLHGFPGFDGVVPEQPPDNRLITTAQRSSLDDDPLGMGSRIVISELGNLALRSVHQPTNTILWWVPFKLWTILIRHPEIIKMNLCIAR